VKKKAQKKSSTNNNEATSQPKSDLTKKFKLIKFLTVVHLTATTTKKKRTTKKRDSSRKVKQNLPKIPKGPNSYINNNNTTKTTTTLTATTKTNQQQQQQSHINPTLLTHLITNNNTVKLPNSYAEQNVNLAKCKKYPKFTSKIPIYREE
jgi:hypothetical protein